VDHGDGNQLCENFDWVLLTEVSTVKVVQGMLMVARIYIDVFLMYIAIYYCMDHFLGHIYTCLCWNISLSMCTCHGCMDH